MLNLVESAQAALKLPVRWSARRRGARQDRAVTHVLIALDETSAAAVLAWGQASQGDSAGRRWRRAEADETSARCRDDDAGSVVVAVGALPDWIALADREPSGVTLAYLRPGALRLGNMWRDLPGRSSPRRMLALEQLRALDARLSACRVVTLEDLYFAPDVAAATLSDWLGFEPPIAAPDFGGVDGYKAAMGTVLRRLHTGELDDWTGSLDIPVGEIVPVREHAAALRYLGAGWSWPEPAHVWSDGPEARLILPLARGPSDADAGALRLRLVGAPASFPFRGRLSVDGRALLDVRLTKPTTSPVVLDAPLPRGVLAGAEGSLHLDFSIESCWSSAGPSAEHDTRQLGYALQSLEVREVRYDAAMAELAAFLRRRRLETVLSIGPAPEHLRADLRVWLEDRGASRLIEGIGASRSVSPGPDADTLGGDGDAIITGLSIERRSQGLDAVLGSAPRLDLMVLWNSALLPPLLGALRRHRSSVGASLPDIAVLTSDPAMFNTSWWAQREAFEGVLFSGTTVIGGEWVLFRPGRAP